MQEFGGFDYESAVTEVIKVFRDQKMEAEADVWRQLRSKRQTSHFTVAETDAKKDALEGAAAEEARSVQQAVEDQAEHQQRAEVNKVEEEAEEVEEEGEEDGLRVVDDDLARQARLQKGEIRNDANESLAQCPGCPYGNLGETQGSNPNPNPFRRRKCRQCRDDSREREAEVQRKAAANPKRIRRLKQRQAQQLVAKKREAQREARLGPRE